ncbi:Hypothetical predicted protein [Mytilus galloprovincialis]|uniref:Uncharacterized protein n=1 Tax=Mytilus galloprovincialis TaxID=29158 RepID=A0A8B6CAM8_MYTGA|nr:Hypothetical predicted protein [Mytilus galloprovincialis]
MEFTELIDEVLIAMQHIESLDMLYVPCGLCEQDSVWIGNRKVKDRKGGVAPAYSKKKAAVRRPSAYTLFSKQFTI